MGSEGTTQIAIVFSFDHRKLPRPLGKASVPSDVFFHLTTFGTQFEEQLRRVFGDAFRGSYVDDKYGDPWPQDCGECYLPIEGCMECQYRIESLVHE